MKLHILSDVHLEFSKFEHHAPTGTDVVVLAGDTHPGVLGVMWAQERFPGIPVIFVPGNHEFYGKREIARHQRKMVEKAEGSNVRVLTGENGWAIIDGVRFVGGTLWTDYDLYGNAPLAMLNAECSMNDFKQICRFQNRPVTPSFIRDQHHRHLDQIRMCLREPFDGPTVVVTHHAPSGHSCHENFQGDPLNPCYASRLEWVMLEYEPALWVHGHIHDSMNYTVGSTCVVSNPRGYVNPKFPKWANQAFDPELLVEV